MQPKVEEKRRFPRIKLNLPIRYQVRGVPDSSNVASDNLSAGGLSFVNNKFIAPETPLMVELNVLSRVLTLAAKVAWVLPVSHSDRYRMGVEFLELDMAEKYYLSDFVDIQLDKF